MSKKEMDMKSMRSLLLIMSIPLGIALLWDVFPIIGKTAHSILDPTAGYLLEWNLTWGMIIIIAILSLFTIIIQKYATDQKTLKELKKEQKILQQEMKKYREHPEKFAELQKESLKVIPQTMMLSSRAIAFTGIPIVLLFRWFQTTFSSMGDPTFLGFFNWFWFYIIGILVFSSIFRKIFDVA